MMQFSSADDPFDGPQRYIRQLITSLLVRYQSNFGNVHNPKGPAPDLEPDLYVTATLAQSGTRTIISRWTAILFIVLGGVILVWCVIIRFTYGRTNRIPELSAFPLLDFAMIFPPDKDGAQLSWGELKGSKEFRRLYGGLDVRVTRNTPARAAASGPPAAAPSALVVQAKAIPAPVGTAPDASAETSGEVLARRDLELNERTEQASDRV